MNVCTLLLCCTCIIIVQHNEQIFMKKHKIVEFSQYFYFIFMVHQTVLQWTMSTKSVCKFVSCCLCAVGFLLKSMTLTHNFMFCICCSIFVPFCHHNINKTKLKKVTNFSTNKIFLLLSRRILNICPRFQNCLIKGTIYVIT